MAQTQRSIVQAKSLSIGERVGALDWPAIVANLDDYGCATTEPLLTPEECTVLAESYDSDELFRSRIVMARHGFGRGEYKYFAYPLPQIVAALRDSLYPGLAEVASGTALWGQYNTEAVNWVDRPDQIPDSNLVLAFEPE